MSDWREALAAECKRTSQAATARRLGLSASTVNQVLKGVYKADTSAVEARVRGELMRETVGCPVLREISRKRCLDEQARPFAATTPQRVEVYLACRNGCPNSRIRN